MALNWATIQTALHAWIVAGTGLAVGRVVWANQAMPQPQRPYVTLRLMALAPVGHDGVHSTTNLAAPAGEEVTLTVEGRRHLTVGVQAYASAVTGAGTAAELLAKAQTALSLPTVHAGLRAAGLAVLNEGGITDLSALLETKFEGRAAMDVRFHCVDEVAEKTGYIATVEIEEAAP